MSDNYSDSFDKDSMKEQNQKILDPKALHNLKLSIDLLSIRSLTLAANVVCSYDVQLRRDKNFSFTSATPTPVGQMVQKDTELKNCFSSYEFQSNKQDLFTILSENQVFIKICHQGAQTALIQIGQAILQLNKILNAPLKQTPRAQVRVLDEYLDIHDAQTGQLKGSLRVLVYLEDNGISQNTGNIQSLQQARSKSKPVGDSDKGEKAESLKSFGGQPAGAAGNPVDYQAVWQLEMWKRAEEAKFKAYLKQKEIERIEEITYQWKTKEQEREITFNESVRSVESLEAKLRQQALDLQRREERIIQLEEELKHKIGEVSRQLTTKEEEVINIKKRFKEEKTIIEQDKKRALAQNEELKNKMEAMEKKFAAYRIEVEQSPLNVLRNELAHKQIELVEMETRYNKAREEKEEYKSKCNNLQSQMIAIKKQLDREKEETLTRQAKELEEIKSRMRQQEQIERERIEIQTLKAQLTQLTDKLTETNQDNMQQAQAAQNPFQTTKNRYLDNFAAQQSALQANYTLNTPNYGVIQPVIQQISPHKVQSAKNDMQRLKREREELVNSGCYTQDDPLIQELDRQIALVVARNNLL